MDRTDQRLAAGLADTLSLMPPHSISVGGEVRKLEVGPGDQDVLVARRPRGGEARAG